MPQIMKANLPQSVFLQNIGKVLCEVARLDQFPDLIDIDLLTRSNGEKVGADYLFSVTFSLPLPPLIQIIYFAGFLKTSVLSYSLAIAAASLGGP